MPDSIALHARSALSLDRSRSLRLAPLEQGSIQVRCRLVVNAGGVSQVHLLQAWAGCQQPFGVANPQLQLPAASQAQMLQRGGLRQRGRQAVHLSLLQTELSQT